MLTYFNPRKFFPFMMTVWACLTMATAGVHKPEHIMAIRIFQGYFESCTFAGTHYILGSWYTEHELGKRSGIFTASGLAGGIIGGLLQSAIYRTMDGLAGFAGWRWLFIVRDSSSLVLCSSTCMFHYAATRESETNRSGLCRLTASSLFPSPHTASSSSQIRLGPLRPPTSPRPRRPWRSLECPRSHASPS